MMARSTTRSNLRPDTLMQDRICQVDETSCNARPDHTFGSKASVWQPTGHFRSAPINRRCRISTPCLKGAKERHFLAEKLEASSSELSGARLDQSENLLDGRGR